MGCYTVPLLAAGIHYLMRRRNEWHDKHHQLLNALFLGAAVFGVIDHAWNKELFVFSMGDVLLGLAITAGVVIVASASMLLEQSIMVRGERPCPEK